MKIFHPLPCPVCGKSDDTRMWPTGDDVYECLRCGVTFFPPLPDDQVDPDEWVVGNIAMRVNQTGRYHD